jgi:hypothetical protein
MCDEGMTLLTLVLVSKVLNGNSDWEIKQLYTVECKIYEETSKSFRTFIFSLETVRAVGIVIGRV